MRTPCALWVPVPASTRPLRGLRTRFVKTQNQAKARIMDGALLHSGSLLMGNRSTLTSLLAVME